MSTNIPELEEEKLSKGLTCENSIPLINTDTSQDKETNYYSENLELEAIQELECQSDEMDFKTVFPELPEEIFDKENRMTATDQDGWRSVASFQINYQIKQDEEETKRRTCIYNQFTEQENVWSGFADEEAYHWLLQELGEIEQQKTGGAPHDSIQSAPAIEITQLKVVQLDQRQQAMVVTHANPLLPGVLKSKCPFNIEVSFRLIGLPIAELVAKQTTYHARCEAKNLQTRQMLHIADSETGSLTERNLAYTAQLSGTMPQPGDYRFHILVMLHYAPIRSALLEIPILQVV